MTSVIDQKAAKVAMDPQPAGPLVFSDKQTRFIEAAMCGEYNYLLFGGGIRGGKTFALLGLFIILCRVYPGSRWAIVRTDRPTLKRNTLPSYRKIAPKGKTFHEIEFNQTDLVATFSNGSQILFFAESFQDDPDLNRWKGLEVNGFGLEEANELNEASFDKAIERAGSWIIPISEHNPRPVQPHPLVAATCNPSQGYLKRKFYDPHVRGKLPAPFYFLQSLITDNPHIAEAYKASLKNMDPKMYKRFVEGSWDATDERNQLISWEDIHKAEYLLDYTPEQERQLERSLGVDVGWFGSDKTVITRFLGLNKEGDQIILERSDTQEVAKVVHEQILMYKIPDHRVVVDVVGVGAGVYDRLCALGHDVQMMRGGDAPLEQNMEGPLAFYNLRAQVCWNAKMLCQRGEVGGIDDAELKSDLSIFGYDVKQEKKILIWDKDRMRKEAKRSPDKGDSFFYGIWGQIYDTVTPAPDFVVL